MKITVTEERECCQQKDLLPYKGILQPSELRILYSFCKYCGQVYHEYSKYNGVDTDWLDGKVYPENQIAKK